MTRGATIVTFVFESTNGALWAEEVAREVGVPVEVVPAPAGSDAVCDLAVATLAADSEQLARAWVERGVPFRLWEGARA